MVRNSVGSDAYVADEIITSRAGVRLRVGNTDAEGRMAMVDVLCHAKEKALKDPNPQLMTIATLTGHAVLAVGPYSSIMDNGPAKVSGTARQVQEAGDKVGDMFEINTIRREDWDFIKAMAMVRNSVGSDAYVADEIITSRAGVRLRVGNTDAEGRMAMVDVLCHAKEKALKDPKSSTDDHSHSDWS